MAKNKEKPYSTCLKTHFLADSEKLICSFFIHFTHQKIQQINYSNVANSYFFTLSDLGGVEIEMIELELIGIGI